MANQQVQQQNPDVPQPVEITPAILKLHNITDDEYAKIHATLCRTPSLTELGIYSVMWSEHCSYKSSKVHLKRLPTKSDLVVQGPGENAGIIDVGEGWACAFKIESHNHPSYIEPYQGAATGVGGILRDIFTMGARPLAVMDSLRFGPLDAKDPTEAAKNRQIMEGVVHGVAGYGNCFGVPNLGGETRFEECYSGNPLLNAFALGLVRMDEIFYAKATGVGNPVIYVGAKTGRDGIHGATMASEEFTEGSEQKRPNVQMGDPFLEKLLLEACLEVMHLPSHAVLGIQDMGAAGLTCSICEMGARGGVGLDVELDLVPQRETGMTSYEIMLSESQERMLLVAEKGKEQEVLDVFAKWGLDAAIVGTVIEENRMKIRQHGVLVADLSNESLTDEAPLYHRPVGVWKAPVPLEPPAWVLEELQKPRDYTADLKKLLASGNICDKKYIFEQYDSMVQTNTVQGPGGEAGMIRIKGTGKNRPEEPGEAKLKTEDLQLATPNRERGLAMALAGNGRWTWLDPKLGAMHAVAEAARKVACTGAKPVAATNCLNFGNPMKPEIMAQLSLAIDGIAEACTALGTPITGGNVSLYNETRIGGEAVGIYPTPVLGIVGIIDDVTKAVPSGFVGRNDEVILLTGASSIGERSPEDLVKELGSTALAQSVFGTTWGTPPAFNLQDEAALHQLLQLLAKEGLLTSAFDLSDGGLAVALAKACVKGNVGCEIFPSHLNNSLRQVSELFSETSAVIVTARPGTFAKIDAHTEKVGTIFAQHIGITGGDRLTIPFEDASIRISVSDLSLAFNEKLAAERVDQVVSA
ncbi:phosphoribosylformylglycinamidine synthase subunit PurL [Terriglobus saanensis]|uniref:Phosphoribosylformylglycinamidine synthase subunit PurL n=1 Tax=Terriglobus saanensis (strain ATCC BAA-1853 / DSM 23119 / SP1PR4) TaxID=401053 RepID=E8V201_TERSS|nr:phosphoribosylformylglycinamidine synthase subunit PurL [Terriglobus saanensis]ADV84558.1 phosphoribosylformylglycinamidine synthase II [Terriglobus saanensis SP1PR4]